MISTNPVRFSVLCIVGYYGREVMGVQQYFSNIVAVSFIGGGNRSTCRKPLTNFITQCCIEYTSLALWVILHHLLMQNHHRLVSHDRLFVFLRQIRLMLNYLLHPLDM